MYDLKQFETMMLLKCEWPFMY